ncbi:SPFH domain-containing protein [Mesomycoplasma neurolyticum]|uniref:Membrane protease subunits, stomatin/prohibitin-like protein n=1 Tax=Mesomycoplasma neurolyticum TaxID=2120 RepID=A0A449A4U6_9BACT|nr:SPFH domain-containing protein [Mesomycoplasma neurolyticum]VEU59259.1 membrane protease subunits, stomatin/prohibitin-like protein [Mesomycoplasma neurolyticum]
MVGIILGSIFIILFLIFIISLLILGIKKISQSEFAVVERLGKYNKTLDKGMNFIIPFVDKIVLSENFKEKALDFSEQAAITKDNSTILVDTVVFLQITDPQRYAYGAEKPLVAIENLCYTTLRNLIGELELDQTLTSRDTINSKLTIILDSAANSWGIKIHRVELKNITPPVDVQKSMEKQLRAEREKRANILEAEGFKIASILKAEGEKEAAILNAEAEKATKILKAEGERRSLELLNSVKISDSVLTLKAIEKISDLANGKATKIIIPPNLQNVASIMGATSGILDLNNQKHREKE